MTGIGSQNVTRLIIDCLLKLSMITGSPEFPEIDNKYGNTSITAKPYGISISKASLNPALRSVRFDNKAKAAQTGACNKIMIASGGKRIQQAARVKLSITR